MTSGVYQWSAGQHAPDSRTVVGLPREPSAVPAAQLFSQLFPSGVQMTGELLADLEQWAHLTSKLATHSVDPHAHSA
jgi:hypothetical protein